MSTAESPRRLPGVLRVLTLFHESQPLGAGTSFLRVTDELAAYGWTATGWLPGTGPLEPPARERLELVLVGDRKMEHTVRGWRESPGVLRRAARSPAYLRSVRLALERVRPHVVHANTLLSLPEAAVARSCGLPIVLQGHEIPAPGMKTTLALRYAANVADVLVGVSEAATSLLRRHAGSTPVLTVRNGVPPFERAPRSADEPFTVGCVGTVSRVKGTDVFLRAARLALEQRPGMRFEHLGAPDLHRDAGLDEELRALLADAGSEERIRMRGSLPAVDVLPSWDVFVSASRSDAFPLANLEAMSVGLPVIAATVGGVPEQIEHLRNGILVRPDDPEAVATWLVRLHDDVELRHRLGDAAARRTRAEFTLDRQAAGLHRAYLAALNRRFAPPGVQRRLEVA